MWSYIQELLHVPNPHEQVALRVRADLHLLSDHFLALDVKAPVLWQRPPPHLPSEIVVSTIKTSPGDSIRLEKQ